MSEYGKTFADLVGTGVYRYSDGNCTLHGRTVVYGVSTPSTAEGVMSSGLQAEAEGKAEEVETEEK
jgi:hypothetical protein